MATTGTSLASPDSPDNSVAGSLCLEPGIQQDSNLASWLQR